VELRVLGPVAVVSGGSVVAVGAPAQCAVLAALAVDAGRLVPVEVLVDRVWGSAPPPRARRTLHTYLTRVRRLLEPGGEVARLVHRSGGYVLEVDADRVDVHRFRRLFDQARDSDGDAQRRVALLSEALGLWRGEPLAGVPGSWAARLREGLRQQHQDAVLAWAQAQLQVGDPAVAVPVLNELVEENPLVEPLTAALMRALHAAGRSAQALDCYAITRKRLVEELGVDPGAELRAVHQAILRGESDQPGPAPRPAMARQPTVVPAQLPADVPGFAGRGEHLAWLDKLLAGVEADAPAAVVISAVSGTAGVGKTALAVHWAHRVREKFPDGQLYVNLRGFDPGGRVMEPAEALRGFLDALGVPPQRVPPGLEAQTGLYRSLLADKRVLVILDNARDAEHVRPLLPGAATALAIVTSRSQLTPLVAAGAQPLTLDVLSATEARELLADRLGVQTVGEPDAMEKIVTCCARLPLALSIAAARAQQSGFPLSVLAGELADAGTRLDALDAGDAATQVRAVLSWSYQALTPAAARLFRLLGLHAGPDVSAAAAASLASHPPPQTRPLLTELVRANIISEHVPGRYAFHDLLRAYAADLTEAIDTPEQRRAAAGRLLDHYTHTAHTAARLLHPRRDPIPLPLTPPVAGVSPEHPADHQQAMAWLTAERSVLLATLAQAADAGYDRRACQLAWTLDTFLDWRGHWHDLAAAWQGALTAASRLGDLAVQVHVHRGLARSDIQLGRYPEAHTHLQRALDLSALAGDHIRQAQTHHNFGYLWEREGQYGQALDHARQALTLFRAAGDRGGQAHSLNSVGWCYAMLGEHTQALTYCRQALTVHQELGDRYGEADTLPSLGFAHHHLAQYAQAIDCYQQALTLIRDLGNHYEEATTLSRLGDTQDAAGNPEAARTAWRHALTILIDLDHPDADTVRVKLHALDQVPLGS
jgi:DNA-binding SARP family transcriptional activator/tetratricopeptide (TPR) repeat protein